MGTSPMERNAVIDFRFPMWRGRPGLASHRHPAGGKKQGQDALATLRFLCIFFVGILIFNLSARSAPEHGDPNADRPTVIVVVGAAGSAEYGAQFVKWAGLWEQACTKGGEKFISIGLNGNPNNNAQNPDDRTTLQRTLAAESKQTDATLWLVLIGHGTFDGITAKFNLRGPDIMAKDLAEWLKPIARPLVVIDTSSSSAPFLGILSGPNRVVITATKSGYEQNYARFGEYLAGAIADPNADLDKDGQTSLLEAFLTASHHVDEFYLAAGRLVTEHALLDDNGDGLGTRADWFRGVRPVKTAENGAALDGYRAHQLCLVYSQAENRMPPELRARRDRLELEVFKLRDSRDKFSEEEYFSRLEKMLYDIALIYEQTDGAPKRHISRLGNPDKSQNNSK
jgi:hypothetical protein